MEYLKRYIPIFFIFLLAGCSVKERHPVSYDRWIAVLPFANYSNDIEIAEVLRTMFTHRLTEKGYRVIPRDTVDARLLRIGITDGGQLSAVSPEELIDTISADMLAYGKVTKANYITLGVYLKKEVELEVSLLATPDSVPFWSGNGKAFTQEIYVIHGEEEKGKKEERGAWERIKGFFLTIGKLLGMQLAEKTITNAISHPLYSEAWLAIEDATRGLPSCEHLPP
jgi:hypothetical protein